MLDIKFGFACQACTKTPLTTKCWGCGTVGTLFHWHLHTFENAIIVCASKAKEKREIFATT